MKFVTLTAAAALAVASLAAPALAQDAAVTVGAKVFGPDGGEVGTVKSVSPGAVVVDTGSVTAGLPADAFGHSDTGLTITMNKADLEAAVNQANAQAAAQVAAALVADAQVYSSDNQLLGTIKALEGDVVVLSLTDGATSLPKDKIYMADGKLTFPATAADVAAAVAAQGQGGD